MLARAARRTIRRRTNLYTTVEDQLFLPWLCPAYNVPRRQLRYTVVDAPSDGLPLGSRKRRNSNDGAVSKTSANSRTYATAVGYMPTEMFHDSFPVPRNNPPSTLSNLRTLEFNTPPLLLPTTALTPPPTRKRLNAEGIGGDFADHISVYMACVQVGKLDRAQAILNRIESFDQATPDVLIELHNEYFSAAIDQMLWRTSGTANLALHKRFELKIRNAGLPVNAETLGYMLKASLQSLDDDRKIRLVRRYMDISKLNECDESVLGLEIFTAEELNQITHICPEYNAAFAEPSEDFPPPQETIDSTDMDVILNQKESPEVRAVPQKGLGLKSLKEALSVFAEHEGESIASLSIEERQNLQFMLETNSVTVAVERWREENSKIQQFGFDSHLQTKSLGARMFRWHQLLIEVLKAELARIEESEAKPKKNYSDKLRCQYGPFLRLVSVDKIAAITIVSLLSHLASFGADRGVPLASVVLNIADNVEDEALFDVAQREHKKASPSWSSRLNRKASWNLVKQGRRYNNVVTSPSTNNASVRQVEIRQALSNASWSPSVKAQIGACLVSSLMEIAIIPVTLEDQDTHEQVAQMQPAFSHSYQAKKGKNVGVIVANKMIVGQLKREPVHSLLAKHLPMLVPPEPWTAFGKGGFLAHPVKVMRIKNGDQNQRHYAEAAIGNGDMDLTFKALDVLGKTPWKINQPLFNIMLEAWNTGEPIANLAPENAQLEMPPEPPAASIDPIERRRWLRKVRQVQNTQNGFHSQRCFQNFQLEIARSLRNQTFYFPHNIDFRGRAYPIPPYLNHIGADHCRGLLKFGVGRALGKTGLRWLKIHIANVYGFDKASLSDREAFAMENLNNIYDSATKPFQGSRWWLTAEDPWQTVAACIELKNALESPDPEKFVSDLPVHQDGTCNGLQHYAALGGDIWGAAQVNLVPGDKPADVYSAVAGLVEQSIEKDMKNGHELAKVLQGKINRKIVKQTVMTNVYGVTYNGAKAQVRKALSAQYDDLPTESHNHTGILSAYIARKIFAALSTMFSGAHDIQHWLGECATLISCSVTPEQIRQWELDQLRSTTSKVDNPKARAPSLDEGAQFKTSVIWTTPLHMPVVQPYRQDAVRLVNTNMQKINLTQPHQSNPVSKRKQLQGFPPNFIHSLDASHMLLSALQCDERGLAFAAVHDSFWTHAADVDVMNAVLRDTFIQIHSDDVVGRLEKEFKARYKGGMTMVSVKSGTALSLAIMKLRGKKRSALGKSKFAELITEKRRCTLLASSDPAEVEEGKSMITPASLIEASAAKGDLALEPDLEVVGLGNVPDDSASAIDGYDTEFHDDVDSEDAVEDLSPAQIGPSGMLDGTKPETTDFQRRTSLKPKSPKVVGNTWAWVPLNFPALPAKVSCSIHSLDST